MYIPPTDSRYLHDSSATNWPTALHKTYAPALPGGPDMLSSFNCCFSLLPLIRHTASEQSFQISAVLTDRGLLAEQTRDSFASLPNESRMATKFFDLVSRSPEERHRECCEQALNDFASLWRVYFHESDHFQICRALLDAFHAACVKRHRAACDVVQFPDINDIAPEKHLSSDDSKFPDEQQAAMVNATLILLPAGASQPAMTYFAALSGGQSPLREDQLAFFIHYILRRYCSAERALRSITPGKQYHSKIAKQDLEPLAQQAKECAEFYVLLTFMQAVRNLSKSKRPRVDDSWIEKLTALLTEHSRQCNSCRCKSKNPEDIQDYCEDFAAHAAEYYDVLAPNPVLLYRLWTTPAQNLFLHNKSITKIQSLVKSPCPQTNASNPANRQLFQSILDFCIPEKHRYLLRNAHIALFRLDTEPFDVVFEQRVFEYLSTCLPVRAMHLFHYPTGAVNSAVLQAWLEQQPKEIESLRMAIQRLPGYSKLERQFRGLWEMPNQSKLDAWNERIDVCVDNIPWDTLFTELPGLDLPSRRARREYYKLLLEWAILQNLIQQAKAYLKTLIFKYT